MCKSILMLSDNVLNEFMAAGDYSIIDLPQGAVIEDLEKTENGLMIKYTTPDNCKTTFSINTNLVMW